jgi:DNA-binding response OmpR family regulator
VECAFNGEDGIKMATRNSYSLIILDLSLPIINGDEVIRKIKKIKPNLPIIITTVHGELKNKRQAFLLGADDYITKPFLLEELTLRIEALLKRPIKIKKTCLKLGPLNFDTNSNCFKLSGSELYLTKKEHNLLLLLLNRKNEVVSRAEILEKVWSNNTSPLSNSVETHIASLRRKLKNKSKVNLIHTFSGRGYKLSQKKLA